MRKMVIESMMDDIIRKFGFENENTIHFCVIAESSNNFKMIKKLYHRLMEKERLE